ncbi:MAG: keto-hydroxyglutarate-aldolase/keto-deoxy-phosphogluconate aldolase, partial [Oscillospiraceae bacterium]|nr:keto-hydroxyglutarate-aldolase/keto-deoxy-phosphogluconate aldolase [Oscillospiraceae bacterium]
SVFAGKGIELMKSPYLGTHGHIAIGTNFIDRAVYHLEMQGAKFDYDTAKYDAKGKLKAIYLTGEFSGFAIHLVQR